MHRVEYNVVHRIDEYLVFHVGSLILAVAPERIVLTTWNAIKYLKNQFRRSSTHSDLVSSTYL